MDLKLALVVAVRKLDLMGDRRVVAEVKAVGHKEDLEAVVRRVAEVKGAGHKEDLEAVVQGLLEVAAVVAVVAVKVLDLVSDQARCLRAQAAVAADVAAHLHSAAAPIYQARRQQL
jgi:hypothetical protein